MMTPGLDAASVYTARQEPPAEVAQFEPDFDGSWEPPTAQADAVEGIEDPQWIFWESGDLVTLWAGSGLSGAGRLVGL